MHRALPKRTYYVCYIACSKTGNQILIYLLLLFPYRNFLFPITVSLTINKRYVVFLLCPSCEKKKQGLRLPLLIPIQTIQDSTSTNTVGTTQQTVGKMRSLSAEHTYIENTVNYSKEIHEFYIK